MDPVPRHAARPGISRPHRIAAGIGVLAAAVAAVIGLGALLRPSTPVTSGLVTAREITPVENGPVPLSGDQLLALLDAPADLGALTDPVRRASCLTGLGYPASTPVLGARPVQMNGRDAVVLVLAGADPGVLVALAVPPGCAAAHTGLLAQTTVHRR
jgi:hypothetical protein